MLKAKVNKKSETIQFESETMRGAYNVIYAMVAKKIDCDKWRGWIKINNIYVRYNPETKKLWIASDIKYTNKYLFNHSVNVIHRRVTGEKMSLPKTRHELGKVLDIYREKNTRFYLSDFKISEADVVRCQKAYDASSEKYHHLFEVSIQAASEKQKTTVRL